MKSTTGKRNIFIGAALAALIVALGVGQSVLHNKADAQGRTVQAPRSKSIRSGRSRCRIIGCSAGLSACGSMSRTMSGSFIAARLGCTTMKEGSNSIRPSPNAADGRRPYSSSIRRVTCLGTGADRGGLPVAAIQSRHPHRLQRQRVDRRQRPERRPGPEVHQGRQVPDAGGPHGQECRQQRPR